MKASHVGAAAERVRAARLEAARKVVEVANARDVDALVLAGDTFEDSDVPRALVQTVADILRTSRAPVLVLPANHDPLAPGGVWEHPCWKDREPHVRVLRDATPIEIGDAVFLPCPLARRTSPDDPTDALSNSEGARDRIRVGIAHGSLLGAGAPGDEIADGFPIDRAVVRRAQLDYLALGHWHVPSVHEVDGVARVAYCGSHEPTKFGERSESALSGECVIATIDAAGSAPRLEHVRTDVLSWRQERRELTGAADLATLRASIDREPAESRERVLLDLVLSGALPPAEAATLDDLETLARARFLHARIRRDGVLLQPDGDSWIEELPPGVPRAVARRLLATSTTDPAARTALDLLWRLGREAAR